MSPTARRAGGGAQALVGLHEAAVEHDAGLLVTETGGDRTATDRDEHVVGDEFAAVVERHRHGVGRLGERVVTATELERDAALAERALGALLDETSSAGSRCGRASTMVTSTPNERQTLANSHADHAAAEHHDAVGDDVEVEGLLAGEHASADLRAGRLRLYEPVARITSVPRYTSSPTRTAGPASSEPSPDTTRMPRAEISPSRPLNFFATIPSRYDRTRAGSIPPKVDVDADVRRAACGVGHLAGVQERLGRDASTVQARAAELVLLDQHDVFAEFGETRAAA